MRESTKLILKNSAEIITQVHGLMEEKDWIGVSQYLDSLLTVEFSPYQAICVLRASHPKRSKYRESWLKLMEHARKELPDHGLDSTKVLAGLS